MQNQKMKTIKELYEQFVKVIVAIVKYLKFKQNSFFAIN